MKETLVINLYGGPGTGKSTTCAHLFSMLKYRHTNCEMALEFAKDKVWEESYKVLENQIYIFGKQLHRLHRLNGKVDCIITDSPLLFSLIYDKSKSEPFKQLVLEQYNRFQNLNFFLKRHKPYQTEGRLQDEKAAKDLDQQISMMLLNNSIPHLTVDAIEDSVEDMFEHIITELHPIEYINEMKNG
jgi:hypothetical protein